MNKERYVSFKIAKLLKEKGFCEENVYCYYQGEYENDSTDVWRGECKFNWNIYNDSYSAPTQQMACRWLREEHEIDIIPIIRHSLKYAQESPFRDYACRVYDCDGNIVMSATKWYSRYENAVEAALQYVLKNLI